MGQDRSQDPLTKAEIGAIIAKAPKRPEGSSAFDMTFTEARDAAIKIASENAEQRNQESVLAMMALGSRVGAYYSGLIAAGAPVQLAETLAASYHDWLMEQMTHSTAGVRAVTK